MSDRFLIIDPRVNSGITVYMDKNKTAYLFVDKKELDNFLDTNDLDYIDLTVGVHSMEDIVSLCYKKGAERLAIKSGIYKLTPDGGIDDNPTLEDIEDDLGTTILKLDKDILPKNIHYNSKLNSYLYFYQTTEDKEYLKKMKDSKFIIPCRVKNTLNMVRIEYLTIFDENAINKGKKIFTYVLFTDLIEYKFWMVKNKKNIKDIKGLLPLELSIKELLKVNKNNGFLINPKSDDVYISGKEFNELFS